MRLDRYIFENFARKKDFAEQQKVPPRVVSQWLRDGYIVFEGRLYSQRRELIQDLNKGVEE